MNKTKDKEEKAKENNAVSEEFLKPEVLLNMMQDLEEEKKKLERVQKRLEKAMEAGMMSWWSMELPSGKVSFDKRKATMLGYSPDKFKTYKDFTELIHPEDYEKTMNAMRNYLKGRCEKYEVEYRIKKKDGSYNWFRDVGEITEGSRSSKKKVVTGIVFDIDKRKKEEQSKESFANIVEKADVGTVITDTKGNVLSSNSAAKRLFGDRLKKGENFGLPVSFEEKMEVRIIRGDGSTGTGKMTSAETVWEGDDAYLIFITDITKQKEAERKVREEVKRLKELDKMRTKFLSMASHELKTPLTPIKAQLQLLQSGKISEEKKEESLDTVLRNVDRLNKLVEDILNISRLESGRMDIERKKQNLKKTIENAAKTVEAEDIDVSTEIGKIPRIPFDEDRIFQVLINLLENAIKHSQGTEIKIIANKEDDVIKIEVRDNGRGIAEEDLKRVFEPFERERKKELAPGTGLGLAISKRIISAHGGEIWAESEEGKGTSVFFTLPLEKTEATETGFSRQAKEKSKEEIEKELKEEKKGMRSFGLEKKKETTSDKRESSGKIKKKEEGLNIKHQMKKPGKKDENKEKVKCPECGEKFDSERGMKIHQSKTH